MDSTRLTRSVDPTRAASFRSGTGPTRRPSGEPPPLPRAVSTAIRVDVALVAGALALAIALSTITGTRAVTAVDLTVVRFFVRLRSDPLTHVMRAVATVGSTTTFRVVAWMVLAVLLVTRRFQHLFVTLTLLLVVPVLVAELSERLGRMRPAGVEILGHWEGYAHPSRPMSTIALALTVGVLVLVPQGRLRKAATLGASSVVVVLAVARLYLAVDHPSDIASGLILGGALPVVVLRLLTPEEAFPVTYRRGVRAHLDVSGRRGDAIRIACARQLGVHVVAVEPFSLAASAGSSPLRIRTADPDDVLFAKLYAASHMRADRWYKLGRTIRYGRLEDERPFNSVRRLVEYEDHMLRIIRDAGVPTPRPYGIVEITPEREYLLVTELIADAVQIDHGDVTDDAIDRALNVVRTMWDVGLAHRDIKPGNVLLAHNHVWLIDVAFAEIRPTPWRQAVDLANMMLTLALCRPAPVVYERALRVFTPDDVAEAFAATRSVTVPSQLRTLLRARQDVPLHEFRRLAPRRPPVAIQRWSLRRAALTLTVAAAAVLAIALVIANLRLAGLL
jgi:tRNA A-37 threonylcarbamoyl transferase component Bud32